MDPPGRSESDWQGLLNEVRMRVKTCPLTSTQALRQTVTLAVNLFAFKFDVPPPVWSREQVKKPT